MQRLAVFLCLVCTCNGSETDPLKSLAKALASSDSESAFQAPAAKASRATVAPTMEAPAELKELAMKLNPVVGYFDPLMLGDQAWWGDSNDATVGFLRHAEIKHGRVAMAAFVGYCLQSNGIVWPWKLTGEISHADIAAAGSPPEQWDALPTASKWQILLFISFLELWSEFSWVLEQEGQKHYMRGGIPGKFPTFDALPHPVPLNLYDPFSLNKKLSREVLDKKLLAELNNGRLAQLGIMAFLAEQKVPGSVPMLNAVANLKPYAGEVMAPFTPAEFWASDLKL